MAIPNEILLATITNARGPILLVSGPDEDPPGRIVAANPAFLSLTGYSGDDLLGQSAGWLTRLADEEAPVARIRNALAQAQPYAGEARLRTRSGTVLPVEIALTPLGPADPPLSPTYYLGQMLSLEPRKELERHLWEAQRLSAVAHLSYGVAQQFEETMRALEQAGVSVANAPRATVEHPKPSPAQEKVEATRALMRRLHAFALPSPPKVSTVNLNHIVRDFGSMSHAVLGHDVALVLDLDEHLGGMRGDNVQLQQVLLNLIINAREAMPAGGTLTITTANTYPDGVASGPIIGQGGGAQVVLSVQDTGLGMSPEVRSQLFEPFFTTKARGLGLGLGLTSVHGIVKEAGGYVWVQSAEGDGTTVRLYFPYVPPA